jgi:predicted metal-dependent phosphoesterase TrpH
VTAVTTRVDAHVKVLDETVVARAKARNIDVLAYAPHFTRLPEIRTRAEQFSDDDLLVVPAREVFTGPWHQRRHVLALGLSDPVPDFIGLDAALREFDRQDAAVLVPHPELLNVSLAAGDIAAHADRIHAVESYNAKCLPPQNRRARRVTEASGKPVFGSSYAHLRRTVGEAWTAFDARIDTERDLVRAFREGHPRRVGHRPGLGHRLQGALEFAHLGWENTWGKFDRLLLSGMEATHPEQVAYGGRFDDDVVEPATERLLL